MICPHCRAGQHEVCAGKTCGCQHRKPKPPPRPPSPGCGAGVRSEVGNDVWVCGAVPARPYACGPRCEAHKP